MLLVDNVGVVANEAGQPVGGSLIFQYAPESVVEMGCYVILVGKDGRLDLYSRNSGVCMQCLSVAKGSAGPCIAVSDDQGYGHAIVIATTYKKLSPEMPLQLASDTILRMLRA